MFRFLHLYFQHNYINDVGEDNNEPKHNDHLLMSNRVRKLQANEIATIENGNKNTEEANQPYFVRDTTTHVHKHSPYSFHLGF